MKAEEASTKKRVSVSQLRPGVYIASLDQSWFESRFYFHHRMIKDARDIELLKIQGVREVVIDTARGDDVETPEPVLVELPAASEVAEEPVVEIIPETQTSPAPDEGLRPWVKGIDAARSIQSDALVAAQNIFD